MRRTGVLRRTAVCFCCATAAGGAVGVATRPPATVLGDGAAATGVGSAAGALRPCCCSAVPGFPRFAARAASRLVAASAAASPAIFAARTARASSSRFLCSSFIRFTALFARKSARSSA